MKFNLIQVFLGRDTSPGERVTVTDQNGKQHRGVVFKDLSGDSRYQTEKSMTGRTEKVDNGKGYAEVGYYED